MTVSFSRYLHPLLGNDFKFLEPRSNSPLLWALSNNLSIHNTNLDECADLKEGEDGFMPPTGPPGSITQNAILIIYSTKSLFNEVSLSPIATKTIT